ncbi:hypothetical protein M404DRAFT_277229 [Pisolithus tinctorius Marx 270]|uniref:Uncharacterized protein n=1 Tax=Pisolithus tinctorius Marx 270 TaxID=870435 RepID=A0A0C3PMP1_PISTI|nr:hypothetical protein M404DRAFT_277229 [Pisolithus tinctorius Marx 270]
MSITQSTSPIIDQVMSSRNPEAVSISRYIHISTTSQLSCQIKWVWFCTTLVKPSPQCLTREKANVRKYRDISINDGQTPVTNASDLVFPSVSLRYCFRAVSAAKRVGMFQVYVSL